MEREWQRKYQVAEENLTVLKNLAHKATSDYDDLLKKYDQNQKQYENVKSLLESREKELQELKHAVEPVCRQYKDLEHEVQVERECRSVAEEFATKLVKHNNNLKRQSQVLLEKVAGKFDVGDLKDIVEQEEQEGNEQLDYYVATIEELRSQVEQLEKKCAHEKNLREKLERQHNDQALQYKSLHRVSLMAVNDYKNLQESLSIEKSLRGKTEEMLIKTKSEGEALKRQSAALLHSAASDTRLMKALFEIETLKVETDKIIAEKDEKIQMLEEELKRSEQEKEIADLESRLTAADEENDVLQKRLESVEQELIESRNEHQKMQEEMTSLKTKVGEFEEMLKPPPPPPPPAPPPLPTNRAITGTFLKRTHNKDAKKQNASLKESPVYQKALEEMMQRIKTGSLHRTKIRGDVKTLWDQPEETAGNPASITELEKVLSKTSLKPMASNWETVSAPGDLNGSGESELDRAFRLRNVRGNQLSRIDENVGCEMESNTLIRGMFKRAYPAKKSPDVSTSVLRNNNQAVPSKPVATVANSGVIRRSGPPRTGRPNSQMYNTNL